MKGGSVHFFPEGYLSPYCRGNPPPFSGAPSSLPMTAASPSFPL